MNNNTGGPAFPCDEIVDQYGSIHQSEGMTLRDYFAAKAMQAFIQRAVLEMDMQDVVIDAYEVADIMLKARKANT